MIDQIKVVDYIRHSQIHPLMQSLKAHVEIAHNSSLHISPSVLKDMLKRLQQIETTIMSLLN
jgi:hypothetical protein